MNADDQSTILGKKNNENQGEREGEREGESEGEREEIPLDNRSELGIPELYELYNDIYNEERGYYTDMSKEMSLIYKSDLELFYKTLHGKDIPLDEDGNKQITKFEQIPLVEYHKDEKCHNDDILTEKYEGTLKDNLFREYAFHVKDMTIRMNAYQDKLLEILEKIFSFKKPKNVSEEKKEERNQGEETTSSVEKDNYNLNKAENLEEPNLEEVPMPEAPMPEAKLEAPKLEGPKLEGPKLEGPKLEGPKLEGPKLEGPKLEGPKLEGPPMQAPPMQAPPGIQAQVGGKIMDKKEVDEVTIKLNPDLDDDLLKSLIKTTRETIVKMYITCETDFLKGISLFEGIVGAQLANTTTSKLQLLSKLIVKKLDEK